MKKFLIPFLAGIAVIFLIAAQPKIGTRGVILEVEGFGTNTTLRSARTIEVTNITAIGPSTNRNSLIISNVLFLHGSTPGTGTVLRLASDGGVRGVTIGSGVSFDGTTLTATGLATNSFDYVAYNVKAFGARGDAKKVTDARVVGSDSNVFSMSAGFSSGDVGKSIWAVETATGLARLPLSVILTVVNATNVIVSTNATATLSSLSAVWGTDDSDAIRATREAADVSLKGKVVVPAGGYIFSKLPFDLLYAGGATNTISIDGAGQDNTVFYPSPAFDFTTTSAGYGMLIRDGNANSLTARGFTLDGLYFGFSWVSTYPMSTLGGRDLFEDIRIENFKNCNAGWFVGGSHGDFFKILISNCDGAGFLFNQCQANLYGCVAQNSPNGNSVRVTGVSGSANGGQHVKWVGGVIDESTLDALRVDTSSDVTFIGAELFGPGGKYAAFIETNCVVRFVGCELVPFGASGDRSGLRVLTNAVVYLEACRLDKANSGLIVSNAGTVYDAGGNNFSGTLTGNPLRTRVNGLIMTDSAVSGPHFTHPTATGYGMRVATDRVDFWNAGLVSVTLNNGDEIGINGDGPIQFFNDTGISRRAAAALAIGTSTAGNIAGSVTTSNILLAGSCTVTQALATGIATVSLTADNQSVSATNRSYIQLSSNDVTAGNRTFVLSSGTVVGQMLDLEWAGTNAGEIVDDFSATGGGNGRLSATWTPTQYDVIGLRWNGTDWIERYRSTN